DHSGDEGAVIHPVLEADFRTGAEGLFHSVAIDTADVGANERPGVAGTEVVVIENPGGTLELGFFTFGIKDADGLANPPQRVLVQVLPPAALNVQQSGVEILVAVP